MFYMLTITTTTTAKTTVKLIYHLDHVFGKKQKQQKKDKFNSIPIKHVA